MCVCVCVCVCVCLCFTSLQKRGHLETAPPFTVPCEGREARQIHHSQRESNPGPSRGSPLHYRYATQAPHTRTHACMHAYIHACMHTCMHTYLHASALSVGHRICRLHPLQRGKTPPQWGHLLAVGGYP